MSTAQTIRDAAVTLPLALDRVDAARYRWLRMQDWFDGALCVLSEPRRVLTQNVRLGADCPSRDRLDTAIGAAMAQGVKP